MKLSDFKYNLPKNQIAKYPAAPRDKAKLMVINRKTEEIVSKRFADVIDYMEKGDVMVVNETRVFQARLFGKKEKTNAKIDRLTTLIDKFVNLYTKQEQEFKIMKYELNQIKKVIKDKLGVEIT